jgi:hypothetical protein
LTNGKPSAPIEAEKKGLPAQQVTFAIGQAAHGDQQFGLGFVPEGRFFRSGLVARPGAQRVDGNPQAADGAPVSGDEVAGDGKQAWQYNCQANGRLGPYQAKIRKVDS